MLNGIIAINKEAGMTSHDVVFRLRRLLQEKKIGHGGTLDPDVTGVLPIAVGKATRVIEYMTDANKVYEGEITLGYATETEDRSGAILRRTPIVKNSLSEELIDEAMQQFVGKIEQTPPMYSAVKVKGKKLYEYAREGKIIDRPSRQVMITTFERISPLVYQEDCLSFHFRVACSKGTYVRTLLVDLGAYLGYASHLSALTRTVSAGLTLENSYTLAAVEEKVKANQTDFFLPLAYALSDLPKIEITKETLKDLQFGRFISLDETRPLLAAFYKEEAVAILEKRAPYYKPEIGRAHV